jgi:hypothetical protein
VCEAGGGAILAGVRVEFGEALGDDPTAAFVMVERENHVVSAHGEGWGGQVVVAGNGNAFEAAMEVVGEQAGEAALKWRQVRARRDVTLELVQKFFKFGQRVGSICGAFEPSEGVRGNERIAAEPGVGGGAVKEDDVREVREALERFDGGERCRKRFDEGQGRVSDHASAPESVALLSRAGERRR